MSETPPDASDLTGVVLAGGYSRRFGERDKALIEVGGRPMLARVVERLGAAADRVVVNCRAEQREAFAAALDATDSGDERAGDTGVTSATDSGVASPTDPRVTFATDPVPDRGPLAGFRTALDEVGSPTCALATCDAPFLDPRTVADLADRMGDTDATALRTRNRLHPTPAVYRTDPASAACDALLDAGDARLSALFDRLDHRPVPVDDAAGRPALCLFDVDTPADRERAADLLDAADESLTRLGVVPWERAPPR